MAAPLGESAASEPGFSQDLSVLRACYKSREPLFGLPGGGEFRASDVLLPLTLEGLPLLPAPAERRGRRPAGGDSLHCLDLFGGSDRDAAVAQLARPRRSGGPFWAGLYPLGRFLPPGAGGTTTATRC